MKSEKIERKGFERVYRVELEGAIAFLVLHRLIEGRAFGGIRIRKYESEESALNDAGRLALAMSRKAAMAGIVGGGAKTVVMEPTADRGGVLRRLGEFIESLGGIYRCGGDLGFRAEDGRVLGETTRYFACGETGEATARSVWIAMRAACIPRSVAIQGLGTVGLALARRLEKEGVRLVASDVAGVRGYPSADPDSIYEQECDVFSPCAVEGVLNRETIGRLRCRVVCGAANNPLSGDEDAERIRARGIRYVPDFVANAGALIEGASRMLGEENRVEERMRAVGDRVREILARADREGRSPHAVAVRMADEMIGEEA